MDTGEGPGTPAPGARWRCAVVAALVALTAASPVSAAGCPSEPRFDATVAEAIDGETVRLSDGRLVRLAGIEAPLSPVGDASMPSPLADAAAQRLAALVAGVPLGVKLVDAKPDRYGRLHAALALPDGRDVAGALVGEGIARVRLWPGEEGCGALLLAAEASARAKKLGIWADSDYSVRRAADSSLLQRIGLYELVEGRPRSVGQGFRMVFIDFGDDYRRDFTVMVPAPLAKTMAEAGLPVEGLVGRLVRVRGVIEEAGGPAIRLSDISAIELIDDGRDGSGDGR